MNGENGDKIKGEKRRSRKKDDREDADLERAQLDRQEGGLEKAPKPEAVRQRLEQALETNEALLKERENLTEQQVSQLESIRMELQELQSSLSESAPVSELNNARDAIKRQQAAMDNFSNELAITKANAAAEGQSASSAAQEPTVPEEKTGEPTPAGAEGEARKSNKEEFEKLRLATQELIDLENPIDNRYRDIEGKMTAKEKAVIEDYAEEKKLKQGHARLKEIEARMHNEENYFPDQAEVDDLLRQERDYFDFFDKQVEKAEQRITQEEASKTEPADKSEPSAAGEIVETEAGQERKEHLQFHLDLAAQNALLESRYFILKYRTNLLPQAEQSRHGSEFQGPYIDVIDYLKKEAEKMWHDRSYEPDKDKIKDAQERAETIISLYEQNFAPAGAAPEPVSEPTAPVEPAPSEPAPKTSAEPDAVKTEPVSEPVVPDEPKTTVEPAPADKIEPPILEPEPVASDISAPDKISGEPVEPVAKKEPPAPETTTAPPAETVHPEAEPTSERLNDLKKNLDNARRELVRAELKKDTTARETAERNYEAARAEFLEVKITEATGERIRLMEERITTEEENKPFLKKLWEGGKKFYRSLDVLNLGRTLREAGALRKYEAKINDSDSKIKVGAKTAWNAVVNIAPSMVSTRTAIGIALFTGGMAIGGVPLAIGAMAFRRGLTGLGGAIGTPEAIRAASRWLGRRDFSKFDTTTGTRKWFHSGEAATRGESEVKAEIKKLSDEELIDALGQFEARAEMDREKLEKDSAYMNLAGEFQERAEAYAKEKKLKEYLENADKDLEEKRKKEKRANLIERGVGAGVGFLLGSVGSYLIFDKPRIEAAEALAAKQEALAHGLKPAAGISESAYGPAKPISAAPGVSESPYGPARSTEVAPGKSEIPYGPRPAGAPEIPQPVEARPLAAAHIEYQGGNSVWKEVENQLAKRMAGQFDSADASTDAQRTWLIDHFKDKVVENPGEYGLPEDVDFNKMSPEQLKNMNWDKLFADSQELKLPSLTEAQQEAIKNYQHEVSVPVDETIKPPSFAEMKAAGDAGVIPTVEPEAASVPVADKAAEVAGLRAQELLAEQEQRVAQLYADLTASEADNNLNIFEKYVRELANHADNEQVGDYLHNYPKDRMAVLLYQDVSKGIEAKYIIESFGDPEKLAGKLRFWDNYLIQNTADFKAGVMTEADGYILDAKGQVVSFEKHGGKWKLFDLQEGNDWKEIKQNRALWPDRSEFTAKQAIKLLELDKNELGKFMPDAHWEVAKDAVEGYQPDADHFASSDWEWRLVDRANNIYEFNRLDAGEPAAAFAQGGLPEGYIRLNPDGTVAESSVSYGDIDVQILDNKRFLPELAAVKPEARDYDFYHSAQQELAKLKQTLSVGSERPVSELTEIMADKMRVAEASIYKIDDKSFTLYGSDRKFIAEYENINEARKALLLVYEEKGLTPPEHAGETYQVWDSKTQAWETKTAAASVPPEAAPKTDVKVGSEYAPAAAEQVVHSSRSELLVLHDIKPDAIAAINKFAEDRVFADGVNPEKIQQVAQMTSETDRAAALSGFSEAENYSYLRYQVKEALDAYLKDPNDSTIGLLRSRVDPQAITERYAQTQTPEVIKAFIQNLENSFREVSSQDALEDIRQLVKKP